MNIKLNARDYRKRRVERLEWKSISFSEIKKGDTFRLFDDTDNPIEVGKPYKAENDAYLNENQIWTVIGRSL